LLTFAILELAELNRRNFHHSRVAALVVAVTRLLHSGALPKAAVKMSGKGCCYLYSAASFVGRETLFDL
jgi:hypothetical protein